MNNFNMPGNYPPAFGSEFPMGGPEIKGEWISKKTGETVRVRDCVISDNGMSVMLSDGRMIDMNEFSNEFYQMSEETYDRNGNIMKPGTPTIPDYNPGPTPPSRPSDIPSNEIDPGFSVPPMPSMPPKPDCGCKPGPKPPCPVPPINPDIVAAKTEKAHLDMITDVFSKVTPTPTINCEAKITEDSKDFPTTQLQMIIDLFGVHIDDIVFYLYKYYFTPEKIMSYLRTYLTEDENGPKLKEPEEPTINKPEDGTNTDTSFGV